MRFELILLVFIAIAIVASILMTSERKPRNQRKQATERNIEDGLSNDFSALIDAIRNEGSAYRKEEQTEDRGKTIRDWITIVVLGLTLGALLATYQAIRDQVVEMKKAYEPIADQAKTTKDNMVADHRAWIGVTTGVFDPAVIDKPLHFLFYYGNTGRQPAPLSMIVNIGMDSVAERDSGVAAKEIMNLHDQCFAIKTMDNPTMTAFPITQPAVGYTRDFSTDTDKNRIIANQAIVSGETMISLMVCILYKSYGEVRHTFYCGFHIKTDPQTGRPPNALLYCPVGNDAD